MTAAAGKLKATFAGAIDEQSKRMRADLETFVRGGAFDVLHSGTRSGHPPYDDTELDWNWHHTHICRALELVTAGEITRLAINVSPGSMKSLLVDVFWPAWEWARNPSQQWLAASANADATKRDCMRCRDLIKSQWYQTYFGRDVTVRKDRDGKTDFGLTAQGWYMATSFGAKEVGSRADRLNVDDPHAPAEVYHPKKLEAAKTWFHDEFSDRLNSERESSIVVIGQRVHKADLFSELRDLGRYEWIVIEEEYEPAFHPSTLIAPPDADDPTLVREHYTEDDNGEGTSEIVDADTGEAVSYQGAGEVYVGEDPRSEDGELMHPSRRGPDEVEGFYSGTTSSMARANLQQQPYDDSGELLDEQYFQNRYDAFPAPSIGEIIVVVEPKGGSKNPQSSDAVIQLWQMTETQAWYLDERYGVWTQSETKDQIRKLIDPEYDDGGPRWEAADAVHVEDAADGPSIIRDLQPDFTIPFLAIPPWASKPQRIRDSESVFASQSVLFPVKDLRPQVESLIEQATAYPRSAKDDRIDCAAYALHYFAHDEDEDDDGGNFGWRSKMLEL